METAFQEIGKLLVGTDANPEHMFPDRDFFDKCTICNTPRNREINPRFKLGEKRADIMHTYDGYTIVSERFKKFCEFNNYKGLSFEKLPNNENFYSFTSTNIVALDTVRRKIHFSEYCKSCNRYASIAGADPAFAKDSNLNLEDGIYRSDIEFGYAYEQHPIFIISLNTYKKMKKEKFKGIYFKKNNVLFR
ncbi:hypothetical protein [Tenacibaculum maritimum]|uniref:hypothetical protein n=1 Tax=Tenacibaculum maritimum TaxID=107401 RepID=UPI0012E6BECD|nr:hypothetical protein [Tenacibaculum maritimum]CAA0235577.1 hypothetical protein FS0810_470002 [Tenacibaculum maritimum]